MNNFGYKLSVLIFARMVALIVCESSYNELIFSPKNPNRGRMLYYAPKNHTIESSTQVPWEDVLKETVILTLDGTEERNRTRKSAFTIRRRQKEIYNAPYRGIFDPREPRFGDIVLMAKGTLEKTENESYTFVQADNDCNRHCLELSQGNDNVTALWTVERIRHRDADLGHRYELKFTVIPLHENKTNGGDTGLRISKSYILREEDYPKYFENVRHSTPAYASTKRQDKIATRRTIFDMFDIGPFMNALSPAAPNPVRPGLNIGEQPPRHTGGRIGPIPMALVRVPVTISNPRVRFPDHKTPFSGQSVTGLHVLVNAHKPTQPLVKPVYDLDKLYDYSKLMNYRGSIDAKKVFPNSVKETTEVSENSLDWKPTTDQQKSPSSANTGTAYQYSTAYNSPITATQSHTHAPHIAQVTTGLMYPYHPSVPHTVPYSMPHIPISPYSPAFFPFIGPPISHVPQSPYSQYSIAPTQSNLITGETHSQHHSPATNAPLHQPNHNIVPPPFIPLHPMTKIRPLSRVPITPPKRENSGFKESQKEPVKFSVPDPLFASTSSPSTSTYKSVLPSPYSNRIESTTDATIFDKSSQFTHRPTHLTDDSEFIPMHPTPTKYSFEPTRIYSPSSTTDKPDAINSQLQTPGSKYNNKIPFVDARTTTKKVTSASFGITGPSAATIEKVKQFKPSSLLYTSTESNKVAYSTGKYRAGYKTTEKPVLKWIPKKQRKLTSEGISSTSTTTTIPPTQAFKTLATSTTSAPQIEATTIRTKFLPTPIISRNSTITDVKSSVNTVTNTTTRYRGRGRFSLKRRGDNRTYYGSLEEKDSMESKKKPQVNNSAEYYRRKLKRTRLSRFNTTSSTTTTTTENSNHLSTATTTPASLNHIQTIHSSNESPEIIKADVRPLNTKIDDLHLFKASDLETEIPSNVNELDNLAVSILEHAKSLHSPETNFVRSNRNVNPEEHNSKEKEILPLEKFFRS